MSLDPTEIALIITGVYALGNIATRLTPTKKDDAWMQSKGKKIYGLLMSIFGKRR